MSAHDSGRPLGLALGGHGGGAQLGPDEMSVMTKLGASHCATRHSLDLGALVERYTTRTPVHNSLGRYSQEGCELVEPACGLDGAVDDFFHNPIVHLL